MTTLKILRTYIIVAFLNISHRVLIFQVARGGLDETMTVDDIKNNVKTFLEGYVCKKYESFSETNVLEIRQKMLDYRFQVDYRGDKDCDVR